MEDLSIENVKALGFELFYVDKDIDGDVRVSYARRGVILQVYTTKIIIYDGGRLLGPLEEAVIFVGNITELSELKSKLKELNISYDGDN